MNSQSSGKAMSKAAPRIGRVRQRSRYVPPPLMADSSAFPEPTFTIVSTFSGCGGSSLGYRWAGGKILAAVEWDSHAAECYRLNFPETPVIVKDIKGISTAQVMRTAGLSGPGELDVLDGSPPCQGFSTAGKRVLYDERNNLFTDYVRLLSEMQPKVCVMENVSGLVKGKMKLIFAEMLKAMKNAGEHGYVISAKLLDAKYLGIPQSRQRMIFIGMRSDLAEEYSVGPVHPKPTSRAIPLRDALPSLGGGGSRMIHDTGGFVRDKDVTNRPSPALTIGINSLNATHFQIEKSEEARADVSAHTTDVSHHGRKKEVTGAPAPALMSESVGNIEIEEPELPPLDDKYGKRYEEVPVGSGLNESDKWQGPGQSCYKPDPERPSPTLPSQQSGKGFATFVHPRKRRALTIAEAKIIMSFPEDFKLTGSYSKQWARLGNAVPPVMMREIATTIRKEIIEPMQAGADGK